MSKIRIKNFGPIKEGFKDADGNKWIDIKKVTLFIGNQGSGKSTVAKLISTFIWMEKALNRGDFNNKDINEHTVIELLAYQGIKNYLTDRTEVEFVGDAYNIKFSPGYATVIRRKAADNYVVPKIMYVPAERSFLSTVKSAYDVKGLPGPLTTFAEELKRANIDSDGIKINLPIRDYAYLYDNNKDVSQIIGADYTINLLEASSGLQSLIPLYLVTKSLSDSVSDSIDDAFSSNISVNQRIRMEQELNKITRDSNITTEVKEKSAYLVKARFHNKCFVNIVEEPEQNLFPTSQKAMLDSLVEFNNMSVGNKLIMTTHSPYLINYLTLSVKAFKVRETLRAQQKNADDKIKMIVPIESVIDPIDLVIYELCEKDGTILILKDYKGLPSDENYLNDSLEATNEQFAQLQEIEKGWL